ncbi:MAG: KH domain-containing protein [Coriobacteriia bacterium]|nr:KH domain-containing protein [Coriobacteriia bacterium]
MAADTERLVDYLVRSLVDDPEAVSIARTDTASGVLFEVTVAPDDVGKVIGRSGRIIKALRILARAAGSADDTHVDVEVAG